VEKKRARRNKRIGHWTEMMGANDGKQHIYSGTGVIPQ